MRTPANARKGLPYVVAAALLVACASVGCSDGSAGESADYGAEWAAWAGEGRWAALSTYSAEGESVVVAWDAESGAIREARGWAMRASEPHAPELWLIATDANSADAGQSGILKRGPEYDSPPDSLGIWRLDEPDEEPRSDLPAKWRAWVGPQWGAYLEVDPLKGVWPGRLLFNDLALSTQGHKAQLAADFGTFGAAGWSLSGRFFAVGERVGIGQDADSEADAKIALIDAVDGSVVATATFGTDGHGPAVWTPWADSVVWVTSARLVALETSGALRDALGANQVPAEWASAKTLDILGAGHSGILIAAAPDAAGEPTEVWRISESGVSHVMPVAGDIRLQEWWEGRGVLGIRNDPIEGGDLEEVVLILLDESGTERELWRSKARAVSEAGPER